MTTTTTEARARLDAWLDELARGGVVPGGVALVATVGETGSPRILHERAFGARAIHPAREAATIDTLYDCASLTKALVTGALMLRLREQQRVEFAQPVTDLVPEMGDGGRGAPRVPSLGELLTHSGGLPAWKPLYAVAPDGLPERAAWLASHRDAPGVEAVYGCPGFQVLGLAIERATGTGLAQAASTLWANAPDPDTVTVLPRIDLAARCAPTEEGNDFERRLAGDEARGYSAWRGELIRGSVHDHNAFTAGGHAGNAGLFATARGVLHLASRFLVPGALISGDALGELSCDQTEGLRGERRTWGFQLATSEGSAAGPALSPRAFGHVGFTGTSCWIDPDARAVHVLLTNRVHPRHRERAFNADRRAFHAASAALVEAAA